MGGGTVSAVRRGKRSAGFSLVEVMVALTISLILLGGAVSILVTSKSTYKVTEQQSLVQENARFALEFLARDLRLSGYFGCLENVAKVTNHVTGASGGGLLDSSTPLEGLNNYVAPNPWFPSNNTIVPAGLVAGTDAITIRHLNPTNPMIVEAPFMAQPSDPLQIPKLSGLNQGDIVAVSDCDNTDIFQITGPTDPDTSGTISHIAPGAEAPGNASANLGKIYAGDATVLKLAAVVYYIGTGASGRPSLFRGTIPNTGNRSAMANQELIDGVENLQLLFGKDTNGDTVPDVYLKAGEAGLTSAANWNSVINVRIAILVATIDEYGQIADDTARTVLDENIAAAGDRRLRRVFRTTVNLRNKAE